MWNEKYMAKLEDYLSQAQAAGGAARVDKQHQSGKATARERMEMLFDEGTFVEVGALRKSSNRVLKDRTLRWVAAPWASATLKRFAASWIWLWKPVLRLSP